MPTEILATYQIEDEDDGLVAVLTLGTLGFGVSFFCPDAEEFLGSSRIHKTRGAAEAFAETSLLPAAIACHF
jgi:hypothetical protein